VSLKSNFTQHVTFEIPSDESHIRQASERILQALEPFEPDEAALFDIKLCIEEALRNAMVHGNRLDKNVPVTVRYSIDREKVTIEVEDRGEGFDHRKVPNPTKGENVLKLGGRGVFLIKYLMNTVEFNEKGNIIKMVKYLPGGSV
jgi:serine/threonine-protein kinase RsbW